MSAFDLRDTIISFSLLQITDRFKQMVPGEVLEVIGSDDGITSDLKRLLPASEYEFMGREALSSDSRDFRLRFRKIEPDPHQPQEERHV